MTLKERVLEFLKQQGFCPNVDPDGEVIFKYQMRTFVNYYAEDDEEFFQLVMPAIFEVTDDNRDVVLEAANKVNVTMKVVKCVILGDSVWVLYEDFVSQDTDMSDVIPLALNILQNAQQRFYQEVK